MSSSNHLSIPQSPIYTTSSPSTSTPTSTPFNPRTHRHKRSQAISGDFDGLGLFNIPPPPPVTSPGGSSAGGGSTVIAQSIPNTNTPRTSSSAASASASHYGHRSALSSVNVFGSPGCSSNSIYINKNNNSNNNNNKSAAGNASGVRTISSSAPKERVVGFADTPTIKSDEEYELDRHFRFNNKDDFANPIEHAFSFPKSEYESQHDKLDYDDDHNHDHGNLNHNYSTSPTFQGGVTYTTSFRKSLSSPIQLSNKLSHSSLRHQQSTPRLPQSPRQLTYQPQSQLQESDVPDPVIDLDYILTANLHIGSQLHDDTVFNTDDFLGSPAIAEEEDTIEDRTMLASTKTDPLSEIVTTTHASATAPPPPAPPPATKLHDEIEEQDLQELQLDEVEETGEQEKTLPQPAHNFYSSTNSSSSSFNSVPIPPATATTASSYPAQPQPPTPSFQTPTRQRSGAKAHRYQIFYDQSNRISNAMRGSAESIERSNTNTPPLSATTSGLPQSPTISAISSPYNSTTSQSAQTSNAGQAPFSLQQHPSQQPALRKTRYLNHYSSLPTLKSKRSFSSIRYNELKKASSPTKEYYRLQSTLSPSKYNGNVNSNNVHFGYSNGSSNNSTNSNSTNSTNTTNTNTTNTTNTNITISPIDLATSLHPPVPQCSTPSTLATQSTAESVSTAISNKRADASTSPISVNSEISSMVIADTKSSTTQQTEVVESDSKPSIVVSTKDLEPSSPNQGSASTISGSLFPIPQSGHSNENSISLQSESTISNTSSSPRIVTTASITNGSNMSSSSILQEHSSNNNSNNNDSHSDKPHPQIVLAPPSSDIGTIKSSPLSSSTSSPISSTFKSPGASMSMSMSTSTPKRKTSELELPSTGATLSRRPLSPTESNFLKQTQIPKHTTVRLDAPMSKYDYLKYPNSKREKMLTKKQGGLQEKNVADANEQSSSLSKAASSTSIQHDDGAALSLSWTNESKLKKLQLGGTGAAGGEEARRRGRGGGHTRSKSNVEDSLSSAGMKRSSRFFDWLRKK
ncbi:hypothetical protein KGF57_004268 [Candida theae]|uniref:Uncharacterized protein n=1 Tax=Candida theae TaxID=1198502 RepID=A0AAD5FX38_9ASCO|nr:uncharacterized protein KGF57_004268 [Candida theae]KAI5950662.1 hypothetical protein KGF57_004268 [Candida theae]